MSCAVAAALPKTAPRQHQPASKPLTPSLLNDRWRTQATVVTGPDGTATIDAFHGEYVLQWRIRGGVEHARMRLRAADGDQRIAIARCCRD